MRKTAVLLLAALLGLAPVMALAHVQNEKSLYEDIQYSAAIKDIVYLRGISAIQAPEEGAQLYWPLEKLTRSDLAYWAAAFRAVSEGSEPGDGAALRQEALDVGLVPSLEGDATYGDINQAYFGGSAAVDDPAATPTREEFALFLGKYFATNAGGKSLVEIAGAQPGPVGPIDAVSTKTSTHDGRESEAIVFTIGGTDYAIAHHPKMLNGPTDLKQWQGKSLEESWLLPDGHGVVIAIAALPAGSFPQ